MMSIEQSQRKRNELQPQSTWASSKLDRSPSSDLLAAPVQTSAQSTPVANLSESFESLSKRLGGSIGLAYAPVGLKQPVKSFGDLRGGVAWSTMKIPVAIATVNEANAHPNQDSLQRLMRLAITESDNAAAVELWSQLGSPSTAAARTQAVLRQGGDMTTLVPSVPFRSEYTSFGQSNWSLAAQATFAASLPCLANAGPVLELMCQVASTQRWGIGILNTTDAFKGGWGPEENGAYLVRQMAVVRLTDGSRIGLSLASRPAGGRLEAGIADLNAIALWLARNIRADGEDRC